ncbi:MAG: hypothetical protein A4E59_01024 [Syntrophorhabdus sp. PtaB.Bin027]|jgi:hypothetical protein|nr:MAG: hypothetical protein A4E59_01024 [Syntrophorhabdus sp. PtaB.Bin027]
MKKSFAFVAVLGLALITFTSIGNAQKSCEDLLGDTVYSCEVKSEIGDGEPFTECLRFNSTAPTTSSNFDLVVDGLESPALGCSCKATGSFKKPKFDASKEWVCVTADQVDPSSPGYTWWGKVTAAGKIIKVNAAGSDGTTFVFNCVIDPACASSPVIRAETSSAYK